VRLWSLPLLILALSGGLKESSSPLGLRLAQQSSKCNVTLSSGSDVAKAIRSAPSEATICLRGGSYPTIVVNNLEKTKPVTVLAPKGAKARVDGIELENVSGVRFVGLHLTEGVSVVPAASRLAFIDNNITGHRGIYMFGDYRSGHRISNVLIEGNKIHNIQYSGTQETGYGYGIEGVGDVRHVLIAHNTIKSTASDYLQSASPVDWKVEANTFLGPSLLGDHEDHQDLWQIFGGGTDVTFTDNVARDTETQESLLFQEGHFSHVVVVNNLFDHDSLGYTCQIYQSSGLVFRRNTVVGSRWGCLFRDLASAPPGGGYNVERNIFVKTHEGEGISTEGRAGSWGTYAHNVSDDGSASGPGSIRHWHPRWYNRFNFRPRGLPYPAGYHGSGGAKP
jgi:Right handed beta helix region